MQNRTIATAIAAAAAFGPTGIVAAATLDFETLSSVHAFLNTPILEHYNGGTAGNGSMGPNFGVQFTGPANSVCLNTLTVVCSGVSSGPGGSANHFAMSLNRNGSSGLSYMNVAAGFSSAISFFYAMSFNTIADGGYVEVFSGVNGSGTSLGRLALSQTSAGASACPGYAANYCPFVPANLTFAGVGRSVLFQAPVPVLGSGVVFDNISISAVPEPQTYVLWLAGLGGVAAALRRKLKRGAAG